MKWKTLSDVPVAIAFYYCRTVETLRNGSELPRADLVYWNNGWSPPQNCIVKSWLDDSPDEELIKLSKFKAYVHARLDDAGIEKNPNGKHSKKGCRIGDRLDIVLNKNIHPISPADWNKIDADGYIHIPEHLDDAVNKVLTQFAFVQHSDKNTVQAACDIVHGLEQHFLKIK